MRIEADSEKLKKLTGFEKVIAACNILGEVDYQPENVMVKEPETDNPVAVKIDHGKSFITFPKDWHTLIKVTNSQFIRYSGYSRAIDRGNLRFNIREYLDSLNQMLKQLNDDKIDALVSQKIAELRRIKFDPKGMTVYVDNGIKDIIKEIKDFDDLERHYKAELKNHISNMKDIAKKMEIVALFSVNNKFQTGGLLNTMADSPYPDPVEYAIHNNIKIAGLDAAEWQKITGYKFNSTVDLKLKEIEDIDIEISKAPENLDLRDKKIMHLINLSDLSKSFNDVEMQLYSCREIIKECNQFLNLINIEEKDRRTETFDTLVKQYDEKAELQEDIKDKIECYKEKIQCYDKEIALNKDIKRIKDLYKQKIDSLKKIADLTENEEIKIECYEGQINCYDKEIALNEDIKSTRYIKYLYEQKVGTLQKIANLTENEEIKKQCQDRILECCKQVLDKEPDDIKFLKKKTEIQKAKTPVKNMSAPISFNGNEIRGLDESSLTILGHESKNEVLELGAKLREHSTSSPSKKPSFNDNLPKQDKSPTGGRGFN